MDLHRIYRPITATPFEKDASYMEFEPCAALKPYIRCFWGSEKPYWQRRTDEAPQRVIIPDTCMDIIFDVNYTSNEIAGSFCGIDDRTYSLFHQYGADHYVSSFGIRFYAWTAILFAERSMEDVKNSKFDLEYNFAELKKELAPLLFDVDHMRSRIAAAERFLLEHIHPERENPAVMDAVGRILRAKGNIVISRLAQDIHMSGRQMERKFRENIGISPKLFTSLVRYQYLWNDVLFRKNFNIQDEAFELGYTDQAHLLNDFRKFSRMSLSGARKHALKDVGFLQETGRRKLIMET